jgi:hypothetical protein
MIWVIRIKNQDLKIVKLILCHSKIRHIEVCIKGLNAPFHKGFFDFYSSISEEAIGKIKCQYLDVASKY